MTRNYFDLLPKDIIEIIYSYDNTNRNKYDKVMNELLEKEKKKKKELELLYFARNYNFIQYHINGLAQLRYLS